jgi:hypothetical protein
LYVLILPIIDVLRKLNDVMRRKYAIIAIIGCVDCSDRLTACEDILPMKLLRPSETSPSIVEFSNSQGRAGSIEQISRGDILQCIQEMCVTLSFMSVNKQCGNLTNLLNAAAAEAECQIASNQGSVTPLDTTTLYSVGRKAQ